MRVAILGGPGSGKGTQAKILSEQYRVPQISTGDLLREAAKNDMSLDSEAKDAMASGRLVEDEVVHKLLEERLRKKDTKRGFIIDGYPRSIPQAQALDALLGMIGKSLQIAINIEVDDDALVKRIVGRMGCKDCGAIYNRYFSPPKVKTKCDRCGGELVSRVDDTAKTAQVRIGVYHEETQPLITYYRAQHKLRTMPGMGDVDEIHQKLCDLVDLEIRPLEIKTLEIAANVNGESESTIIAGGRINRVITEVVARKPQQKKKVISLSKTAKKKAANKSTGGKKATKKIAAKNPHVQQRPAAKKKKIASKPTPKNKVQKKNTVARPGAENTSVKKAAAKKSTKKKSLTHKVVRKKSSPAKPTPKTSAKKKGVAKVSTKVAKKKTISKKTGKAKAIPKSVLKITGSKITSVRANPPRKSATKKSATKKSPAKKIAPKKAR